MSVCGGILNNLTLSVNIRFFLLIPRLSGVSSSILSNGGMSSQEKYFFRYKYISSFFDCFVLPVKNYFSVVVICGKINDESKRNYHIKKFCR